MANPVQSVNSANPQQSQTQATALRQKPSAAPTAAPQDKITISESAKQALANSTRPGGGDVNHDGDGH